jgi:hypothetical protein
MLEPVRHRDPPAAAGEFPDVVLEVCEGRNRPTQLSPVKLESEEGACVDRRHPTLVLVDRKPQLPVEVLGQTRHDALTGTNAFHQNNEIVGIAGKPVAPI